MCVCVLRLHIRPIEIERVARRERKRDQLFKNWCFQCVIHFGFVLRHSKWFPFCTHIFFPVAGHCFRSYGFFHTSILFSFFSLSFFMVCILFYVFFSFLFLAHESPYTYYRASVPMCFVCWFVSHLFYFMKNSKKNIQF